MTYTWNIRIEYGGIRSVHNRSWIFVKIYLTFVVLLEYDGKPFNKRILWQKVGCIAFSWKQNFDWIQSMCDMRAIVYVSRQSKRFLEYSWRAQRWRTPGKFLSNMGILQSWARPCIRLSTIRVIVLFWLCGRPSVWACLVKSYILDCKFQFPSFGFDRRLQGNHYSSQINRSKAVERHF